MSEERSGTRSLLRVSREMKRRSPVFIVGEARSGTSILYRTLQKHSSFRPRKFSLVETQVFSYLHRAVLFGSSPPQPLRRFMLEDAAAYERFLTSTRLVRLASAVTAVPNLLLRHRVNWLWLAGLNHLILRSYFFHATAARGCRRLLEKTPTNTRYLRPLATAFPNAQFLYLHRHPVDVFSSYRRRGQADPAAGWARRLSVEEFCATYEASVGRVRSWAHEGRTNLLMIRYERLTTDPVTQLQSICAFLREPYEDLVVEDPAPDPGRWWGDPLLWGPIVPVTRRYSDLLTPTEVETIQRRLSKIMYELDYQPFPSSPDVKA
jgi:hypothetical protein